MRPRQQLGHGPPAGFSVVDGVGVHVHADETIGAGVVEPAAVRLRVRQRLRPVGETVLNARLQVACDVAHQGRPEVTAHHVPAERQRQPRLRAPPLAQVDPEPQPAVGVGKLALVDQQSRVCAAGRHVVFDLIERHDHMPGGGLKQLEREKRRGELTGHGDAHRAGAEGSPRIDGPGGTRHDARSVAVPEARAVGEQRVPLSEVRIGVQRDRRDLELAPERAPVQRFDVAQLVDVAPAAGVDLAGRERPEHERVVGIGAMRQMDRAGRLSCHASPCRRSPASPGRGRRRGSARARRTPDAGARARRPRSAGRHGRRAGRRRRRGSARVRGHAA